MKIVHKIRLLILLLVAYGYAGAQTLSGVEYYFDTDPGVGQGTYVPYTSTGSDTITFDLSVDVTGLSVGFHRLYVRSGYDNNVWSLQEGRAFYVLSTADQRVASSVTNAEYYFDTDPGVGKAERLTLINAGDSIVQELELPITGLTPGFHKLFLRAQDAQGFWSLKEARAFYVLDAGDLAVSTDIVGGEYFFDTDPGIGQGMAFSLTPGDSIDQSVSFPIAGLEAGFHKVGIRTKDTRDQWSVSEQRSFYVLNAAALQPAANLDRAEYFFNTDPGVGLGTAITQTFGADSADFEFAIDLTGRALGQDTLYVRVIDEAGVASLYQYSSFEIANQAVDLETTNLTIEQTVTQPGSIIDLNYVLSNVGDLDVTDDFRVATYISLDENLSADDIMLSSSVVTDDLTVGASVNQSLMVTISESVPSGDVFALVHADSENVISEFNDTNNIIATSVTIDKSPELVAQTFTLAENPIKNTAIGTIIASDPEGQAIVYNVTAGNDLGGFTLDANSGELAVADTAVFDFETNPTFVLTVEVSDENNTTSAEVTINLTDLNESPEIADQSFSLDENSADIVLGSVVAIDPENDALVYSFTSGNDEGYFAMNSENGEIRVEESAMLDFETKPSYLIEVTVSDGVLDAVATITIQLNDVNEAPSVNDEIFSVDENSPANTEVGLISATDPENQSLSYAIASGNELGGFAIPSGTNRLIVADESILDFETNPTFILTVDVSDGTLSSTTTITINLNDIVIENTAPVIDDQTFTVDENSDNGTVVGIVIATDAESDPLTFVITSGNDLGGFSLNSTSGELSVADVSVLDFETNPTYSFGIEVADDEFNSSATITVNLNDVNETPSIANETISIDENSANGTVVSTVTASDPDGDALTYTITEGNTNDAFLLDGNSGELTVANAAELDFETTPTFTLNIEVTDGSLSNSATITIDLNDVNEAPSIADQTFTINENSGNGTAVATLTANDPDSDALTFSITNGNTNGVFALNVNTGEITVASATDLSFETTPAFTLGIEVTDGALSNSATVTINLNDVNEAPSIADQTFTIDENSANGTVLATLASSDPDGDALTYAITNGNTNSAFALDANTGELTVASESELDFETTPTFNLTVEVSDGALTASASITVNLNDVNENAAPTIADQTFTIDENSEAGVEVGTVVATDPDGDVLSYEITSRNDGNAFNISTTSGKIVVADPTNLDFELNETFTLKVEVSDGELISEATITINLNDVDESVLGVGDEVKLSVYPIPANDVITIHAPSGTLGAIAKLIDGSGKVIKQVVLKGDNQMKVHDVPEGIYYIKVDETLDMIKVIIK